MEFNPQIDFDRAPLNSFASLLKQGGQWLESTLPHPVSLNSEGFRHSDTR